MGFPKLLRQPSKGNRIFIWTKVLADRSDMVPVLEGEVERTDGKGYVFKAPQVSAIERVEESVVQEDTEPKDPVDKPPSHMNKSELQALEAKVAIAYPDLAVEDIGAMKRADMVDAVRKAYDEAKLRGFEG